VSADTSRLRLGVLGIVVLSLFATLLARLWYLQVMASPELRVEAAQNGIRILATEAPRGRILDRQGRVLVDNQAVMTVTVDRVAARERPDLLERLAPVVNVGVEDLTARLADERFSQFKPAPVADVDLPTVVFLRENARDYPGVQVIQRAQRLYPHGRLAAHVVGYVGQINDRELDPRRGEGYEAGDSIGKSGVELAYESVLRGQPQVEKLRVDREGRVLDVLGREPAVPGHDVVLTLDLDVQAAAERALAEGVLAARQRRDGEGKPYAAPGGAAVVLDPRDGSVVAMASYPDYDPGEFVGGISADRFTQLNDPASGFPLNNRAIQGLYPPASTFKMMTAVSALENGVITPSTVVDDRGRYEVGGRVIGNAGGASYGPIALARALTVSSDVYFYGIGEQFWNERGRLGWGIQETARSFGLGSPTQVELPFEAQGRVYDPDVRKALNEANPEAFPNPDWFTGDNVNMAIGQGDTVVTPLQLANAYATFANGGTVYATHVGGAVTDAVDGSRTPVESRVLGTAAMSEASRQAVLAGLVGAVGQPGGTAYGPFLGFPLGEVALAGKTGTGEVRGRQDTALYVGFGPVGAAEYVAAVVVEEAGLGSQGAAPVARKIFDQLAGLAPPAPPPGAPGETGETGEAGPGTPSTTAPAPSVPVAPGN